MNKAMFRIIFTLVWAAPVVVLALWTYVFRNLREMEERQSDETDNE